MPLSYDHIDNGRHRQYGWTFPCGCPSSYLNQFRFQKINHFRHENKDPISKELKADLSETRLEQIERLSGCNISFDENKGLTITAHSGKHFWDRYKPDNKKFRNGSKSRRKFFYCSNQNK